MMLLLCEDFATVYICFLSGLKWHEEVLTPCGLELLIKYEEKEYLRMKKIDRY